jgi:uncharacterized radical SAM superfamily Fe-S cluster-containing enzyme
MASAAFLQQVKSLCPGCYEDGRASAIPATIFRQNNEIIMAKTCEEHGDFEETLSRDADFYLLMEQRAKYRKDLKNPGSHSDLCPNDCGLCANHKTPAMMGIVDLTSRCNLSCPVCFANAGVGRHISKQQVEKMLSAFSGARPFQPPCIQFAGGEPTIHPEFFDILKLAREMGFTQLNAATNGVVFAKGLNYLSGKDFAQKAAESGLNMIYLQFDGLSDDIYRRIRGRNLLEIKLRAIENASSAGIRTILVPTIIRGINDCQIGDIYRFALGNISAVSGISWQPVSFSGRIDYCERKKQRYTLTDLAENTEQQFPVLRKNHWYPMSGVSPISHMISMISGKAAPEIGCHPHCGIGTVLVKDPDSGEVQPIPEFVDVEKLFEKIEEANENYHKKFFFKRARALHHLSKILIPEDFYKQEKAPGQIPFGDFAKYLLLYSDKRQFSDNKRNRLAFHEKKGKYLTIAGMHFQDAFNFEVQRCERCTVHYAAPDGKVYPFCTYNCGPRFRKKAEQSLKE